MAKPSAWMNPRNPDQVSYVKWSDDCIPLYTADAAIALIRAEALEEAARCAEEHSWMVDIEWFMSATKQEVSRRSAREVAAAIRAMKEKP